MAKLADALDLGSSAFGVQVQLLSSAPLEIQTAIRSRFFLSYTDILKKPTEVISHGWLYINRHYFVMMSSLFLII